MIFFIESTNASLDITINEDRVLEKDEMFNVSIDSISNDHIVGIPGVATVTIIDTTSKLFVKLLFVKRRMCVKLHVHTYVCMYIILIFKIIVFAFYCTQILFQPKTN